MHVFSNELYDDDRKLLAKFSCHMAAFAAMMRFYDPTFKRLSGDKPEDLEIEKLLHTTIDT